MSRGHPAVQNELFDKRADLSWFHTFRATISSGDAAQMGGNAFLVLATIKAHADYNTGRAWPGQESIARQTGLSVDTVQRALDRLVQMGYLSVEKSGRKNVYTVKEKIAVTNDAGTHVETMSFDYVPAAVKAIRTQIKTYLDEGKSPDARVIQIDKLVVNLTIQNAEVINNGVQINADQVTLNADGSDDEALKERLRQASRVPLQKIRDMLRSRE